MSIDPTPKQFTVMVIKPDAVQAGKVDEIVERVSPYNNHFSNSVCECLCVCHLQVRAEGMEVLAMEERLLSKEDAAEFYKQHEGSVITMLHILYMCVRT